MISERDDDLTSLATAVGVMRHQSLFPAWYFDVLGGVVFGACGMSIVAVWSGA